MIQLRRPFIFFWTLAIATAPVAADPGQPTVARMAETWDEINSYECTATVHEISGKRTQDRVYEVRFVKPATMRVDIVDGDGKGSAAIWRGGSTVYGHQGGWLSPIKLTVSLHSKLATDLRGTSFDQGNFGALIARLQRATPDNLQATTDGDKTLLEVQNDPPPGQEDITKEVYVLGLDWLPLEYYQYAGDTVVKHVVTTGLKVNVDFPPSTWDV